LSIGGAVGDGAVDGLPDGGFVGGGGVGLLAFLYLTSTHNVNGEGALLNVPFFTFPLAMNIINGPAFALYVGAWHTPLTRGLTPAGSKERNSEFSGDVCDC
jgi:hypothetical protein